MRIAVAVLLMCLALPSWAEKLTIERIFSDPQLTGPTPRGVKIAPDGSRVGFLRGAAADQYQLDLWAYDVHDASVRLLVDSHALVPHEVVSDAEKQRRERERTADFHGILNYSWSPDGRKLLFPLGDDLYLYDLETHGARKLLHVAGGVLDPRVSPRGGYVSYLLAQNLWVLDLHTGKSRRLTVDGGGTVHNGEAEFIAQEEMDRASGYWWAPDDSAIAFERYDETKVPVAKRFEVYPDHTDVVEERYPAAGDPNVTVKLGLVSPRGGAPRWANLGTDPDIYLARVNWLPDAKSLAFQRLTRDQQHLDLVRVEVSNLRETTLLTETSKTWIDLNDDVHFLEKQPAFVWGSDRSGYHQLYLFGLDGKLMAPLTEGDYNIDQALAVDESVGKVYFAAGKDDPLQKQVYAAKLDGSDAAHPVQISQESGWHEAVFPEHAPSVSFYVDRFSDSATPQQASVRGPEGQRLAWIEENRLDEHHPYWPYHELHGVPEFGTLKADDGQDLYYSLLKPPGFDPTHHYPVFITVYGGPHVQTVDKGFPALFKEYMAQRGYLVFSLDNRGSARRGRRFTDPIYRRLGDVEVRDQLAGVHWLKQQPYVDGAHIGVFGWSYGGFMTTMLLAKGSADLAAGAAVAPVTDWRVYDTMYTERYLQRPSDNAAGYEDSAVFKWLNGLTSSLFLAHGMADDNVLFTNSTKLMSALQAEGIPFRLMTYPGGKHGLSTPAMHKHVYHAIQDFMDEKLKPAGAR